MGVGIRILLAVGLLLGAHPAGVAAQRLRLSLNEGWRYADGPADGAETGSFDDGSWARVTLPHTWNANDAFSEGGEYRRGVGWYRRPLEIGEDLRGRRIYTYFEGANEIADVFVNGASVGRHTGGYTAFVFDITDHVRYGEDNLLAVRVDNAHHADVPPLEGDFTFFGGIYRDVWLIATDPVRIDVEDFASPGIYVDTPELSAERGTVRVRGTVVNGSARGRTLTLRHRLTDPSGAEVATFESRVEVAAGARQAFESGTRVERPRLWSPETPIVHRLTTEVIVGDTVLDRVDVPMGFRWFRATANGFELNGRPYRLHGANRHQDRPGIGNALTDAMHREDVEIARNTGFNFLRLAHYPQDPAVLEAADALGIAVWEEIPIVARITMSDGFAANAEHMLVEMIRQHYNHPSVVMWGYMNEVGRRRSEPREYDEAVVALARRLETRLHEEDPARLSATAISYDEVDGGTGRNEVPQALGLNLYFGWYYRDMDELGSFLDEVHARLPDRPLLISEYGAGADDRVHATEPVAQDFSTEFQQRIHETAYAQIASRPWLVGTAVWSLFDFSSARRQDTRPGLNQKGLYRFDRTPRDVAAFYQARLLDTPVLHIAARDWLRRAGSAPEDAEQELVVYSNRESVELFHDGASLGASRTEGGVARWTVRLHDGRNRFEARSGDVHDDVEIEYADRTAFLRDAASEVREIAVNVGGAYSYTSDIPWEPDHAYRDGRGWGHEGGWTVHTSHRIPGSIEEPLFQSARVGIRAFRIDVPDGEYEITLAFAELEDSARGQRVFDVTVNGAVVAAALDLAGAYGPYQPVSRRITTAARQGSGITVELTARRGQPTLSGIRVRRR